MNSSRFVSGQGLGLLLLVCGLGACKPEDEPQRASGGQSGLVVPSPKPAAGGTPELRVVLSLADAGLPYQRIQTSMLAGLARTAEGYELVARNAGSDAARQSEQLLAAASSGVRAALIQPVDPAALEPALSQLRRSGAIVIGLDGRLVGRGCDTVVYCDQQKVGKLAGDLVVGALRRKAEDEGAAQVAGRIVQLRGSDDDAACAARNDGLVGAIQSEPGIVVVHDAPARWDKADAVERIREAFRIQKTFDVIYAHNDLMALGASQACTEVNRRQDILIVGTDGLGGPGAGLEMLRQSDIDATVHQPLLVDFAWRVVRKMIDDPAFKPKPAYELQPVVITPKNLDDVTREGYPQPAL